MSEPELMTPERREEIRARTDAATPGPWGWPMINALAGNYTEFDDNWTLIAAIHHAGPVSFEDRAFIARARTDVPALLTEVDRLQTACDNGDRILARLEDALARHHATIDARRSDGGCPICDQRAVDRG